MSVQIGDVNIVNEIVELHFQVLRTQLLLDLIIRNSVGTYKPSQQDIASIETQVLQILNQKFPNMGIARKS